MKEPRDWARALLEKASSDLRACEILLDAGESLDMACFHAQQAVEKSLKAVLALRAIAFPWRHDLGELVVLAGPHVTALRAIDDEIIALAPYAVAARYDDDVRPSPEETRGAFGIAKRVFDLATADVENL